VVTNPDRPHEYLIEQVDGTWIERAAYFEAVSVRGDGVFDTLRSISKLVLKTLG
jgi:hypothetical protein